MQRIRLHIKRTIVCSQVVGGNGPRAHEINLDNNVKRRHVANWENSEDLQIASCFFKQQFFFCCIIIKKRESHRLKILMLPFSPLHHLYSPQLTRMAFETVIKCLRSTRPLHYSWVPIDHILLPLCCGDHCNILNPPKQIGDLTEIKKITILAIDQRKSFCLILNPAFETKLDDVRESLIGKMQKKKKSVWFNNIIYWVSAEPRQCDHIIFLQLMIISLLINLTIIFLINQILHKISEE